jgi:uncharacterized protein
MSSERHKPATMPCLCNALRQATRAVSRLYDEELCGVGLRTTQNSLLRRLSAAGAGSFRDHLKTNARCRCDCALHLGQLELPRVFEPAERIRMKARHSWLNPKLEVRVSPSHEKGVFARETVLAGERLAILGGDIMFLDEIHDLPEPLQEYPMQIEERFVLGNRRDIDDTDYFNHSCDPNAGFKGQIFLVAMRRIPPGEEVTFDYAMVVSESVGSDIIFKMNCRCGASTCRAVITEHDWKRVDLQKRYQGFFSEYLREKIETDNH